VSRFVRLCETASPAGEEGEVASLVRAELEALGLAVVEDDVAARVGAGSGNLLARIPGEREDSVAFCSHLDTVPHDEPIEVVLDEAGIYRSAGDTILGADNKAAVAVLIELAARYSESPPPVGVELLFTVSEEVGLKGAAAMDPELLESGTVFVLDLATEIGAVVTTAPTHHRFEARIRGRAAHAGLSPERGRSAIQAAARAVSDMELGRLDDETTANVGTIEGGTSGNVIPGFCRITGEARSVREGRSAEVIQTMADEVVQSAASHGCEADVITELVFAGYRVPDDSAGLLLAEASLMRTGHEVERVATGGGSDANVFRAAGLDAVLLANGTFDNHMTTEWVPRENLARMVEVCEAIIEQAGQC
jgi:tripeptide aminopeptidase